MRKTATTLASELSAAELAKLVAAMRDAGLSGWHLEIGTAAGGTLRELMRAYPAASRPRFVVVDPMTYFPGQLSIVRRNLASAGIDPGEVDFRISKSWPAFQVAERAGERYAFIFVDGSHKAHRVMQDVCWARLLVAGGLICFHDYSPRMPGVVFAVDRLMNSCPNYRIVDQCESLLVLQKTVADTSREVRSSDLLKARIASIGHQLAAGAKKHIRQWS
jgi:predicted O-methyltransferase YrrM